MKHLITFAVAAFFTAAAWAHGGEDHSHDVAPALTGDVAPRASAQTEDFELVAVLAAGKLTLYLDRYADNAPVADAEIEVESGAFKAVAAQASPGVYVLPGEVFAQPGKYPLAISIQAGESADLLTATLDLSGPSEGVEHKRSWDVTTAWSAAGVLLLAGAGLVVARRRKQIR
ncbi:MAG: LPXTG cell wall anchor domain-containing protein [Betaproteobacteria bacterium]|jgi:LPXTG-motif cell wall-anchored protein|nr:LPXTG cell wall anchor domain-containing protein [Betaproteobacteria bacterium]